MRIFSTRHAVALTLLLGLLTAGCEAPQRSEAPKIATRIVTFAPNLTEIVYALGQGDRVIGVSSFCTYPPEVMSEDIARVGGHFNPNLERLAALQPDLVLLEGAHAKVAEFAALNNIRTVNMPIDSLATLDKGIAAIGELLDCEPAASQLRSEIRDGLEDVQRAVEGRPRPRVLIISARPENQLDTLFTVGGASFLSELVTLAGGANIFADAPQPYFEASKETVVVREPEVILEFHSGENLSDAQQDQFRADWQALPSLPAVRQGRIYLVLEDYALIPGPRVVLTARSLARLLHPEAQLAP
jgi:iron complex transport system substrate-binding protein